MVVEKGGIVVLGNKVSVVEMTMALAALRAIEPDKPICILLEDFEVYLDQQPDSNVLSFLDGQDSINNVLILATTNYPEKLDGRITNRPRRFDMHITINPPGHITRKDYFIRKLKCSSERGELLADKTDGFTFAGLADVVIQSEIFGREIDEVVGRVKKVMSEKLKSGDFENIGKSKVGFATCEKRLAFD
jgi:SpoVK/Ycf46/Vps4 family AAA+-type ATPase